VGILAVIVVMALILAVAAGSDDPTDDSTSTASDDEVVADDVQTTDEVVDATGGAAQPDDSAVENPVPDIGGQPDEVDDVGPCEFIDAETVQFDITNNSSKQSSYIIDVNFLDAGGQRLGDEPFFINHLRPGERAVERKFVFESNSGVACEIAEVERYASRTVDDVSEVTCEVDGVDFANDLTARFVATNDSDEISDYLIDAAFIRDGIRIGTSFGSIDNVRPGESAPGDGFSFAKGPDTGVTCEVVHVERLASK
jgi:hypothetical protein